ncbi:MAG TPA: hypothetical protein VJ781_01045 [Pyrinomonadaceae bacterium]|nr:hypothetical protein [Pyrinomonadaceae bacterium]
MYCSGCASEIQTGLNYCSRCGRRVVEESKRGSVRTNPLVIVGNTVGVGVVAFIFVLLVLVRNGITGDVLFGITLVYFGALVVICMMLFWQARVLARDKIAELRHSEPAYIRPATTAQLTEPTQSPASVTDNTTRTLDEMTIGQRQF